MNKIIFLSFELFHFWRHHLNKSILPTYNRAELFLSRAINSVVNQTYENWELIIIDNNSIDKLHSPKYIPYTGDQYEQHKQQIVNAFFKHDKKHAWS